MRDFWEAIVLNFTVDIVPWEAHKPHHVTRECKECSFDYSFAKYAFLESTEIPPHARIKTFFFLQYMDFKSTFYPQFHSAQFQSGWKRCH